MRESLRKSGIDVIGDVPWGTHLCQFYQTKEDLMDILVPYFKEGLENNEFCLWITSKPLEVEEAKEVLGKAVPDIEIYLEKGQIEIIPYTHGYVNEGVFGSEKVINGWVKKLDRALASGYEGLRTAENTSWLKKWDWDDFADYEKKIDASIGKHQIISLCSYFLEMCSAADIIDVAFNHQFALVKNEGKWERIKNSGLKKITEDKQEAEALRQSEQRVRLKLENILSPSPEMTNLELAEIIDTQAIQSLMDDFYKLAHIPIGIIDLKGNVLVGVGWQDICTKFHRVHPETCKHCLESDTKLSTGVFPGEFKPYKCKNNMWDIVTPIMVGGQHIGNIFLGQFFFEGETLDYEFFRSQARQYGFNEEEYIAALEKVPRLSREVVDTIMAFFMKLANILSQLGYSNIKLAQSLEERNALVDELRDNEERFRSVLENSLDAAYRRNLQIDRYDYMSPVIEQIAGFSAQEMSAMSSNEILDRIHPEDQPLVSAKLAQAFDSGLGILQYRFKCKDSKYRWFADHFTVSKDQNGRPLFSGGIVRDITERKKAEEALRLSNVYNRSLIEANLDPLVTIGRDGKIMDVNGATEKVTGYSRNDLIGTDFSDYYTEPEKAFAGYQQVFTNGEVRDYPLEIQHKDGHITPVLYNASVYRDENGKVIGVFASARDITELKRAEETLAFERSQLLSIFDGIDDVVYVTDPYTYEVLYANKAMKEKFGGELVGGICYREFQRKDSPCDFCTNPIILKERDKPYHWEYYNPMVDRYFMIVDRIIKWPDGRDVRFEIAKDITERKRAEDALKKAHNHLEVKVKERTAELEKAYNSLKESEKGLAEAQKMAHIGNWKWNIVTNEKYWSDEIYRIFGHSPQEFEATYDTFLGYIHPDDRDYVDNVTKEALKGKPYSIDFRIVLADGEERIVHEEGEVVFDEKKIPIRMTGTIQDITEFKKAEEKIQRLANAVESSNDAIVTESLDGIITSWNKAAEQIYGYSAEEILGQNVSILEPDNVKGEIKQFSEKIKRGEKIQHYESSRLKKDGNIINVSVTLSPIFEASGELVAFSAIVRDVTERKRAEEALRESEARLHRFYESGMFGMLYFNLDGSITDANDKFLEIIGYTREDLQAGQVNWNKMTPPEYRLLDKQCVAELKTTGVKEPYEKEYIRKDGSRVSVILGIASFDHALCEGTAFVLDITTHRQGEHRISRYYNILEGINRIFGSVVRAETEEELANVCLSVALEVTGSQIGFVGEVGADRTLHGIAVSNMEWARSLMYDKAGNPRPLGDFALHGVYGHVVDSGKSFFTNDPPLHPDSTGLPHFHQLLTSFLSVPLLSNGKTIGLIAVANREGGYSCEQQEDLEAVAPAVMQALQRKRAEIAMAEMDRIRIKEIHHRIKNNLQVISSLLDLQAEKFRDKKVLEAFRESQSRVLSMSLIHEELYKGEGTDTLDFSVYLQKLAENLFQTYSFRSKNVHLCMDLEENTFFDMDTAIPLGIIVNELVSNSLKHAFTEKEGEIRIKLCREEKDNETHKSLFSLTISDNGKGIPENVELESLESLGLQLVSILVDQLDGKIELKREHGTEFRITLDVAERS